MRIFNFGSLNIDKVYSVDHFVQPGETLASSSYKEVAGGKGLNQSIALARAGAKVSHIGKIGKDGIFLKDLLSKNGVDVSNVMGSDEPTGNAIIQVDNNAENAIILFGGANQSIIQDDIERALDSANKGDWLLLQNEVNNLREIMQYGAEKGLVIAFNPAPMTSDVHSLPLNLVSWLIVNESEGEAVVGQIQPEKILDALVTKFPNISILLTLGSQGVHFADKLQRFHVTAKKVIPVDTTGAGDTFIGFFFAEISRGNSIENAMRIANRAAAISVTRQGAADSIPQLIEL